MATNVTEKDKLKEMLNWLEDWLREVQHKMQIKESHASMAVGIETSAVHSGRLHRSLQSNDSSERKELTWQRTSLRKTRR